MGILRFIQGGKLIAISPQKGWGLFAGFFRPDHDPPGRFLIVAQTPFAE
jgi:hypothetical protein